MSPYLGLDIGSTAAKGVLVDASGSLIAHAIRPTGHDALGVAAALRDELAAASGTTAARVIATGYGRARVDFAHKAVTEITCHARGIAAQHPEARTLIDIGGQDAKAIRLAAGGAVEDFAMNDRCAAGTGSFLDVISRRFDRTLADLSDLHSSNPTPLEISSTCVVFAESEVVGLIARGHAVEDVLAGVMAAIARRIVTLTKQIRPVAPVYFAGGVGQNESLRRAIEAALALPVTRAAAPQLNGALGAALLARSSDFR